MKMLRFASKPWPELIADGSIIWWFPREDWLEWAKFFALPWRHARVDGEKIVANLETNEFENLPILQKDEWPAH